MNQTKPIINDQQNYDKNAKLNHYHISYNDQMLLFGCQSNKLNQGKNN